MTALPSLKQLHYLIALSEHLNFTRAAESCFVTQSTLSAGLKELEGVLGARLVERDRQTVLITPIGLEVVARARAILAATQDLADLAAMADEPMTGLLRFGVIPTIAPFLLPRMMQALRERYPRLKLALREDLTAKLLSRLEAGQLDFALIALPYETAQFLVEPLFDDALWMVGLKEDPELKAKQLHITSSVSDRLLLLEEGHCLRNHVLSACSASASGPPDRVEATSLLTLVQMVESGLGVGLIPEMAVRSVLIESPNLVARRVIKPAPKRTIALVARRSMPRHEDLKALAALIRTVGSLRTLPRRSKA